MFRYLQQFALPFAVTVLTLAIGLLGFVAPAHAQDAQVQIIHNSPDPDASTVDIYIEELDGTPVTDIQDVDFRTATGFLSLAPGDYNIFVAGPQSTGSGDAIVGPVQVTLAAGMNYTVVANGVLTPGDFSDGGTGNSLGFTLDVAADARPTVDSQDGDVEIRAVHGSPDAPTVDVLAGGAVFVNDAAYNAITGYANAGAGPVTLEVTPGNDNSTVVASFDVDLTGFADETLTVVASGFLTPGNQTPSPVAPFTLIAVDAEGNVIDLGAARVQIIHNAPDPAAETVDIYVDGELAPALDDFAFRSATPFIDLNSGVRSVAVAPGNSTGVGDAIATFDLQVEANASLAIIASGVLTPADFETNPDGEATGFELLIEAGVREVPATAGNAEVLVVHGAPDAPTVDAFVPGAGVTLADGAAYTGITDYTSVPTGTYPVSITDDSRAVTVATFTAPLTSATTALVLASGFYTPYNDPVGGSGTEPALGLLAVFPNGDTALLPVENTLSINEFLADPTVTDGGVDANGDGTIDTGDDFVEIMNISSAPVDISGYELDDEAGGGGAPYVFPAGTTLEPGEAAVIFSGGTPAGIAGFVDVGLPALNNGGDDIILRDDGGNVLQSLTYPVPGAVPEADGVSTARNVNGVGGFALQADFGVMTDASAGINNDNGVPLPVEFGAFTASIDGNDVVLNWTTLSETNNAGFDIQQKFAGSGFRSVGQVEGQGTTSEPTEYAFRVTDLESGTHQFRLRQVDIDGVESFSSTVTATINLTERYTLSSVAPNPVTSKATATLQVKTAQPVTVELYDLLGRRVSTLFSGSMSGQETRTLSVDASSLPSGVYFLRVQGEQFDGVQRFVVTR
ncbi:DUF4397 domain-containing protein [Longibacter salinarum]|nr:DUF4397 domain-containing protein [Longibacter salinarum]